MGKWADESFRAWAEHSVLEQLGYKRDRALETPRVGSCSNSARLSDGAWKARRASQDGKATAIQVGRI